MKIDTADMGGWMRVNPQEMDEVNPLLASYLSHVLSEWFRARQHLRLRFVVPVTFQGNTVELHAWYDQITFPDKCPLLNQSEGFE